MEALLSEINVPDGEIEKFTGQIKERDMGRLFANFEPYDVQATRKEAREEGEAIGTAKGKAEERENGIARLVKAIRELGGDMEVAAQQLAAQYGLDETTASGKVKLYW